jgi:hypothetical protein
MGISEVICRIVLPLLGLPLMCVGHQPELFLKGELQDKHRYLSLAIEI